MNIFQAMRQVGHIPVVQGFWKNVMIIVGLIGSAIMLAAIIIGGIGNWMTFSLVVIFIAISSLGLYIPFEYVYSHKDAKTDIDFFFSLPWQQQKEAPLELNRALAHMTKGTTLQRGHNISCRKCWDYYMKLKRKHCGG